MAFQDDTRCAPPLHLTPEAAGRAGKVPRNETGDDVRDGLADVDLEELRERFPLVGLVSIDEPNLSERYREINASARLNRKIVEAIEAAQRRG